MSRTRTHTNHAPPPLTRRTHTHTQPHTKARRPCQTNAVATLPDVLKNKTQRQHRLPLATTTTKGRETALLSVWFLRRHSLKLSTVPRVPQLRRYKQTQCFNCSLHQGSKKARLKTLACVLREHTKKVRGTPAKEGFAWANANNHGRSQELVEGMGLLYCRRRGSLSNPWYVLPSNSQLPQWYTEYTAHNSSSNASSLSVCVPANGMMGERQRTPTV